MNFLDLLSEVLNNAQYAIIKTRTGQEALTSINKLSPDLILLDLSLPDINGFKIANLLKANPRH